MIVSKPPPNRNTANAITIKVKVIEDGLVDDILRNHRLIEKDIDEACFLTFFDISCSSLVIRFLSPYFS